MTSFADLLVPIAVVAVAFVLLLGLLNIRLGCQGLVGPLRLLRRGFINVSPLHFSYQLMNDTFTKLAVIHDIS